MVYDTAEDGEMGEEMATEVVVASGVLELASGGVVEVVVPGVEAVGSEVEDVIEQQQNLML